MSTTAQGRRGKPRIMPPRKHGPEFSVENTWSKLSNNIREIQNHNASNLSFEENHRFAYNMVLYKHGDMLYRGVKQLVTENLEKLAQQKVYPAFPSPAMDKDIVQSSEEEMLLKALRQVWDDHTSNMVRLGQILRYMDRVHTQNANVPPTAQMGLDLFIKHIMRNPIKDRVISAILNQVRHEREGNVINRSAVKECVDVFLSLQVDFSTPTLYKNDLEPKLLEQSKEFYEKEGRHLLATCDSSEYLRLAEARFDSEDQRTHHYLSSQTAGPLKQILKDQLLTPNLLIVIAQENSGFDVMIDLNKTEDLSRLYRLCMMIPTGLKYLRDSLKGSITHRGKAINENSLIGDAGEKEEEAVAPSAKGKDASKAKPKGPMMGVRTAVNWVQEVLSLKDKFDAVWKDCFQGNREVENSLIEAFGTFVNSYDKSPEFISLFIDDHLKRGLKGKTDLEVEAILEKTISVFRFLGEKDVFERYYKGHLAKRLLQGRSVNDDAEQGMLVKFKIECGVQFTRKMEGMFHDMRISQDTTRSYHEYLSKTTAPEIELSVVVMTSNCWPTNHSDSPCVLPPIMAKACKSFEQFYLSKHSGRCLSWQLSLGNADVKARFKTTNHELNVSTFALVILLLFENLPEEEFLTYSEIKEVTTINDADLKRHLQSLACAKFKILKKHPPGRDVSDNDSFSFNNDFTSQMTKIKIGTISSRVENTEERKETRERMDEERRHQIEACIVRVMKSRKHMSHNELINEVMLQLATKFVPEPTIIKRRIEALIEREFLERSQDRKSYNYLA